nr:hypothetical protein [Sicyoidochytrium minutum DNA virus]
MAQKSIGECLAEEGATPDQIYIFEIVFPTETNPFIVNMTRVNQTTETLRAPTADDVWDIWFENMDAGNFAHCMRVYDKGFFKAYKRPKRHDNKPAPKESHEGAADDAKE